MSFPQNNTAYLAAHKAHPVSLAEFRPSSASDRQNGFLGHLRIRIGTIGTISAHLRRRLDQTPYICYPQVTSSSGRKFPTFVPAGREAQDAIQTQVFAELRALGESTGAVLNEMTMDSSGS